MSQFESIFEDLDVKVADVTGALESVTGSSVQQDEVSALIQELQSEQGINVGGNLAGAGKSQLKQGQAQQDDVGEMQRKLDMLKNI